MTSTTSSRSARDPGSSCSATSAARASRPRSSRRFVRYTVRALAIVNSDPAEVLRLVDVALTDHDTDRYCTLVAIRLDLREGRWDLDLSLAGHVPPLLRSADGSVRELGELGSPVGLVDDVVFRTVHHRLSDGETLTLYTDGVTEARGPNGLYGEVRLRQLIASAACDVQTITDSVVLAALAHQNGNASDDIAVVTLGPTSHAG